jgi:hypothetical protein
MKRGCGTHFSAIPKLPGVRLPLTPCTSKKHIGSCHTSGRGETDLNPVPADRQGAPRNGSAHHLGDTLKVADKPLGILTPLSEQLGLT